MPLLLKILGNMCIAIENFEINLILIKLFFYMIKKSKEKFEYLENDNSF